LEVKRSPASKAERRRIICADATDKQVLQAVKDLIKAGRKVNEYRLMKYCQANMYGEWSDGKVHKSVQRLEARGRVKTELILDGGRACRVVTL
jgi:hypothetical protein